MSHKSEKQAVTAWEEEVQRLATQLEQQRPLTQRAPHLFKQELRQKLLTQYDQPALSWQDWGNLWRFAGTAVTLIFLFVAAGWAWTTFSQQSAQTSITSQQEDSSEVAEANYLPVPLPTATPIFLGSVENMPVEMGDNIWLTAVEYNDTSFLPNETLEVTLTWEAVGQPSTNYTAFINLLDTQGKSISQVNIPLGDTFNDGTSISKQFQFLIPNEQPVGNLSLRTGLYNPLTGAQIPQASSWNTLGLGLIQVETAVTSDTENNQQTFSLTPPPPSLLTPTPFGLSARMPVEMGDGIWLTAVSYNDTSFLPNETLEITLTWETRGQPSGNYTAFVHLDDRRGNLIAQADISLEDTFIDGTSISKQFALQIPDGQTNGTYILTIGLYDPITGKGLPQTNFGYKIYLEQIEIETAVAQFAIVSRTNGNGLTLYNVPNEHTPSILTLEEGDVLIITHEPTVEHNGFVWQQVTTSTGQIGWVVTDFIQLLPQSEPTEVAAPEELQDTLEILSILPPVGTIITQTTRFEVNIAYNLETERKAEINVMFGPNDGSGVAMFYGFESVTQGAGELQITFEIAPATDLSLSNPTDLILVAHMGRFGSPSGTILVSSSAHISFDDAYHYQP